MDMSRAKNIILLLLLALNIFLLADIIVYARGQGIPKETIQNSVNILKARGVELKCAIPTYNGNTPKLVYGNDALDHNLIVGKLLGVKFKGRQGGQITQTGQTTQTTQSGQTYLSGSRKLSFNENGTMTYEDSKPGDTVDVAHTNAVDKYVRTFVKDSGLIDALYVLDSRETNQDGSIMLTYIEKYKGYLIFDNYLKANVAKYGIISLESGKKKIKGFSQDKAGDVAAAYQILLGNFRLGVRTVITGIDFGFYNSNAVWMQGISTNEQFPVWRITVKNSDNPRYFSASDGKEINVNK